MLRPNIQAMHGYVPGEQPKGDGVVKLNTNENPYPPSPKALAAMQAALTSDRLRKYPEPRGDTFRRAAGTALGVDPESILIGNGSDDILTILTRTFVPEGGAIVSVTPSYLLYSTLADIQGATYAGVPFAPGWGLPDPWPMPNANLTFVANPNSPSGTIVSNASLEKLAGQLRGPLVIDEAYADFSESNALELAQRLPNVIVTRTLSKSYSLAGLRFGFAVAAPELVREFDKVKDSYNCDVISLAGAAAAIEDQTHLHVNRQKIVATRTRLADGLRSLGFDVLPSSANFVWATRRDRPVQRIALDLKRNNILVRYLNYEEFGDGLRITVGTDAEVDRLLNELQREI